MCIIMCSLTNVSMTLHTTDVKLTGLQFPAWHFFPCLNSALICASFQLLGTVLLPRDWLNIIHRGFDIVNASSFRTLGCILSGPGDLSFFSPLRIFQISSSFIFIGGIKLHVSFTSKVGVSPSGSFVKTLLKKFASISAFSSSSSVLAELGLL